MPLVKNGGIVADPFLRIGDDDVLPADDRAILLSAARFPIEAKALMGRDAPFGVIWPNDRSLDELLPYLDRLSVIALVFPSFRDGRAYSQARLLRERHHYRGELRATGQVLRDQFSFLHRAGFDAYDVSKPADADAFGEALRRYSVVYQRAADGRKVAFDLRQDREPKSPAHETKQSVS
jgi:uncharacterized protein (DUF934 family)